MPGPPREPSPAREDRLYQVLGQDTAIQIIRRALATGRIHHAYLFSGPHGVGRELAAFGFAQALVCERRGQADAACGTCSACVRALPTGDPPLPKHPDIVVLERGLYEPSMIGRRTPETQDLSIDQIRTLVLARGAFGPHEGRAKVFIIRRPEELSMSAANALLKTLEEPLPKTCFILLTSQPSALLPTILSRVLTIRFGPLTPALIAERLIAQGHPAPLAQDVAERANGSLEVASALAMPEKVDARTTFIDRVMKATAAPVFSEALELAAQLKQAKGELSTLLEELQLEFSRRGRAAAVKAQGSEAEGHARSFSVVAEAREHLEGNASPQLVIENMMTQLRQVHAFAIGN